MSTHYTYFREHISDLIWSTVAWGPYLHKDIDILKGIKKRVTELLLNLKNLPYHQRLKELGLITLQERRTRGDLIEVYMIIEGINNISGMEIFLHKLLDNGRIRKHNKKLFKKRKLNFFNKRVIEK